MRKLILQVATSLDNYIEDANGAFDWCFTDQDYGQAAFFKSIDAVFIGRKSYELLLSFGDAGMTAFPKLTYYVFSTTLNAVKDGDVLIKENMAQEIEKIKNSSGKNIWLFGGASLTSSLMNEGLVDEISLAVHPILLGSGKPLFSNINERVKLELFSSKTYSTGLVVLRYGKMK